MKYFLFAALLAIYFEFLGRYFLWIFHKKTFPLSFCVGITFTMAFFYLFGWPISAFNLPSIYYSLFLSIYFLVTTILILKNIKKIDCSFNFKFLLFFLILLFFEIYTSWNKTLGDPHGFDAVYYINYISSNVDANALNSVHPLFGTTPNTYKDTITYVFQSYNYFVSSLIFIIKKVCGLVSISIDFLPAYYWIFQIQLHIFFISISLISIKEISSKNKLIKSSLILLLILFMNNFYYNTDFGFIGNTFRMSVHALATIFLFRYFKEKDHTSLFLFFISMLGLCGFSSTGTFATIFVLFGLFFYLYDKELNLIKYYCLVLYIPVLNILCVKFGINAYALLATTILFIIVYFLNNMILNLYKNKYLRIGTIVILVLFLIIMNMAVSGKVIDFYGFIKNYSETQDMSWDYFDFYDIRHWVFNLLVLIPLFFFIFKEKKHPFSIICIVLILTFFNPLAGTFINKLCWVYYRTYDIIINQFTLAFFINYLLSSVGYNKIACGALATFSIMLVILQYPRYYHYQFKPDDDYNHLYKIENSELEMIRNVQSLINDDNLVSPKIINTTFYMNSFIEDGEYLIGKERRYNYDQFDETSYALYLIFYPSDGWDNFRPADTPDYDNVTELLKKSNYDMVIVDNGLYITYKGEYITLADAICSDGTYQKSEYSTANFAVIKLYS